MKVSEVVGMEGDKITLADIYEFDYDAGFTEDGEVVVEAVAVRREGGPVDDDVHPRPRRGRRGQQEQQGCQEPIHEHLSRLADDSRILASAT